MPFGNAVGQGFNNGQIFEITISDLGPEDGLFFYDPSPGAGNLVGSITFFSAASGTDQYGNTVYHGFQSYTASGGHTGINNGIIQFAGSASVTPAEIQTSTAGGLISLSSGGVNSSDSPGIFDLESADVSGTGGPAAVLAVNSLAGVLNVPLPPPASPGTAPGTYSQSFEQTNYTGGLNNNISKMTTAGIYS